MTAPLDKMLTLFAEIGMKPLDAPDVLRGTSDRRMQVLPKRQP
jgi:hypothetical protein